MFTLYGSNDTIVFAAGEPGWRGPAELEQRPPLAGEWAPLFAKGITRPARSRYARIIALVLARLPGWPASPEESGAPFAFVYSFPIRWRMFAPTSPKRFTASADHAAAPHSNKMKTDVSLGWRSPPNSAGGEGLPFRGRGRHRFTSADHAAVPHSNKMKTDSYLGGLRPPKPSRRGGCAAQPCRAPVGGRAINPPLPGQGPHAPRRPQRASQ